MKKGTDPRNLAVDLLPRSICTVKVAAVISDSYGIYAWGWNSVGKGMGLCAEAHAIGRASKKRLKGSTIYVAGKWRGKDKAVPAKPCESCQRLIDKHGLKVVWRDKDEAWCKFEED